MIRASFIIVLMLFFACSSPKDISSESAGNSTEVGKVLDLQRNDIQQNVWTEFSVNDTILHYSNENYKSYTLPSDGVITLENISKDLVQFVSVSKAGDSLVTSIEAGAKLKLLQNVYNFTIASSSISSIHEDKRMLNIEN